MTMILTLHVINIQEIYKFCDVYWFVMMVLLDSESLLSESVMGDRGRHGLIWMMGYRIIVVIDWGKP